MSEIDPTNEENFEDDQDEFNPDPAQIAFLDQEEARFGEVADQFEEYYGFRHECHCGQDYAAGRIVEIPLCFANLTGEAMMACARLKAERDSLYAVAEAMAEKLRSYIEKEKNEGDNQKAGTGDSLPENSEGSEA